MMFRIKIKIKEYFCKNLRYFSLKENLNLK